MEGTPPQAREATSVQAGRIDAATAPVQPALSSGPGTDATGSAPFAPAPVGDGQPGALHASGTNPTPTHATTAETARHVAAQIAQVVTNTAQGSTSLTLRPEELGRVSLHMRGDQDHLAVTLTVERPETFDLVRRHIDMLGQDLRRMGYESVSFSFQGGNTGGTAGQGGWAQDGPAPPPEHLVTGPADPATPDARPASAAPTRRAGLDLRF